MIKSHSLASGESQLFVECDHEVPQVFELAGGRAVLILHRRGPWVVMEVVEQLGVHPPECNTAVFAGKDANIS